MAVANFPEVVVGFLLVFFVPGYALVRATFPEWRLRGPSAGLRLVETFTLSLVLSVTLTVLVGYGLLVGATGGFQAYWTDPLLEAALAAIAAVGFAGAWYRGAFSSAPPSASSEPAGEEGAWELTRELDRIAREERRLTHQLRVRGTDPKEGARLRADLDRLAAEREALQRRREAEYAS